MTDPKPGLRVYRDGEIVDGAKIISTDGEFKVLLAGLDITGDVAISWTRKVLDTDPDSPGYESVSLESTWLFSGAGEVS